MNLVQILRAIQEKKIESIFDASSEIFFDYILYPYQFRFRASIEEENELENALVSISHLETGRELDKKYFIHMSSVLSEHLQTVLNFIQLFYSSKQVEMARELENELDKEYFRYQWIVLKQSNFRDINLRMLDKNPVLRLWFLKNITKDEQESFEEKKIELMFQNPQLYSEVFAKEAEKGEIARKALEMYRLRKLRPLKKLKLELLKKGESEDGELE